MASHPQGAAAHAREGLGARARLARRARRLPAGAAELAVIHLATRESLGVQRAKTALADLRVVLLGRLRHLVVRVGAEHVPDALDVRRGATAARQRRVPAHVAVHSALEPAAAELRGMLGAVAVRQARHLVAAHHERARGGRPTLAGGRRAAALGAVLVCRVAPALAELLGQYLPGNPATTTEPTLAPESASLLSVATPPAARGRAAGSDARTSASL